jgi:molybdopterin-guanine dinucleotide biosynthesis protein A
MRGGRDVNREEATLIILAGGSSRRMGRPKHLLPTPYGRLIDHLARRVGGRFVETLVVGRDLGLSAGELRFVADTRSEQSPLVGIHGGLTAAETDLSFVLACDLPFAKLDLIDHLLSLAADVDIAVPVVRGYLEPLFAAYRRTALGAITETLDRGILKVTACYDWLLVREVPESEIALHDPDLASFVNLNVPEQLHLLSQL